MLAHRPSLWLGFVVVVAACLTCAIADDPPVRYDHWKLVRVHVDSWDDIGRLHELGALLMSENEAPGVVDYLVPPASWPVVQSLGLVHKVINDNIQKDIDAEQARLAAEAIVDERDPNWFTNYKTITQVYSKLATMQADRPDLVTLFDIGVSHEGRQIRGIRITGPGSDKPAVQFNGCHHAREWISVMVPMWIADKLVYEYDTNPQIHSLVDRVEFFIIPIVNVDGYAYSWSTNRLWRKNRHAPPPGYSCYGVDDNRNYGVGWGGGGSSSYPCDETYRGTAAFSEPETAAMRDFTLAHPNIVVTMSYHSYSQLILSPWGYTSALPPDNDLFLAMDGAMHDAILAVHGMQYDFGPIYSTIYQASGGDVDWYYGHDPNNPIFAFTIELRDTGQYGFQLPADQIIPTCEENFAAALYLAEWAASPVQFSFPDGLPSRLDPGTPLNVSVQITAVRATIDPNSPRLWARFGSAGAFAEHPLVPLGNNRYQATLPATPCGRTLEYYFSAQTTGGVTGFSPGSAPDVTYSVVAAPIVLLLNEPLNANPGWTTQGQWAFGQPTGGGSHNRDPGTGQTGSYVYGYNLAGDYINNMPAYYLTTPAFNCTGVYGVQLSFWRWLGVESNSNYDKATVEVSGDNGATWTAVWRAVDTGAAVSDSSWVFQAFDISALADNRPQVRIRWSMGPTDPSVTYPGWNIDDVQVWAADPNGCPPLGCPGDMNCDGLISYADIDPFVEAFAGESAWPYADCPWLNADLNGDGEVTYADIDPFVSSLGTECP